MVESTHDLVIGDHEVVKRYRFSERGEPDREWEGLSRLHRLAPGLAPEPIRRWTEDGVPVIVMSRVGGEPLGSSPLTPAQVVGLGAALHRMYGAVPPNELSDLAERNRGPADMVREVRSWCREPHAPVSAEVESALEAARGWVDGPKAAALADPLAERVFTNADGNIGNFLWNGDGCCVVDFEDGGVSDPAYEVADLVEHVSVWLPGLLHVQDLVRVLEFTTEQQRRQLRCRRLMATFWLLMLLPGNPGHPRNPTGSVERQAQRVLAPLH